MAPTKVEMSEYLFDKLGSSKRDVKELAEPFFEETHRALKNGKQVKLPGFGNFDLCDKNQRPGRSPKTGEDIPIIARRVVTFRPGRKLESRVENAMPKEERFNDTQSMTRITKKTAMRPFSFSLSNQHRRTTSISFQQNGKHVDFRPSTAASKRTLDIITVSTYATGNDSKLVRRRTMDRSR